MKKKKAYLFAGLFLATLLSYWLLTRSIAFIPSWDKALFIASIILSAGLLIAFIWTLYRSYTAPIQPIQGVILFLCIIVLGGLAFFGIAFARLDNKTTGIFSHFEKSYHFKEISFYIYETNLMGRSIHVRYSRQGEITSHLIDQVSFWNDTDSVKIEQRGKDFLIYSNKHKYLFSFERKLVEELP